MPEISFLVTCTPLTLDITPHLDFLNPKIKKFKFGSCFSYLLLLSVTYYLLSVTDKLKIIRTFKKKKKSSISTTIGPLKFSVSADIKTRDFLVKYGICYCSIITFCCEVTILVIIMCIVASILAGNL